MEASRNGRLHDYTSIRWNILEPFVFRVMIFHMKILSMVSPHPHNVQNQERTLWSLGDYVNVGVSTLVREADNRSSCICVGAGGIWEISVPSPLLC